MDASGPLPNIMLRNNTPQEHHKLFTPCEAVFWFMPFFLLFELYRLLAFMKLKTLASVYQLQAECVALIDRDKNNRCNQKQ